MNMKSKILLVLLLCVSIRVMNAQSGTCGDGVTWELNYTTLTIKGSGSMADYAYISAPWESYKQNIKKIVIEDGVEYISGFEGCSNVDTVLLGNKVGDIGERCFFNCSSIKKIAFPSSIEYIRFNAFKDCGLDSLSQPGDTVTIFADAFKDNDKLVYVNLSGRIDERAFFNCANLKKVILRGGELGQQVFCNCSNLRDVEIWDGVTKIGSAAFLNCDIRSVTVPASVKKLAENTFANNANLEYVDIAVQELIQDPFYQCTNIKKLILHEGLSILTEYAFQYCEKIDSVYLPSTLKEMGIRTFGTGLTSIRLSPDNPYFKLYDGALLDKDQTRIVRFPNQKTGSFSIPPTVKQIEQYTFEYSKISNVVIPESVVSIGFHSFAESKIVSLDLPSLIKVIPNGTAYNCVNLKTLKIPEGCTTIGSQAFEGTALRVIEMPESMDNYGEVAFFGCAIDTFKVKRPYPAWINANVFGNVNLSKAVLVVPESSKSMYETADVWKDFGKIIGTVGNEQVISNSDLRVYPTYATNNITVEQDSKAAIETIAIYGSSGAKAMEVRPADRRATIDISGLPSGFYIVKAGKASCKVYKK